MNHDKLQELLPLYVLGILETPEQVAVESHLATGCAACSAEHRALSDTATELAFSVTPVSPPPHVHDAILRAATSPGDGTEVPRQLWKTWSASDDEAGLCLVRATEGTWEPVMAGISVKRLSFDAERRLATMLVRMAPGTSYPSHRHALTEECYVLEGDLQIGATLVMHAGDFQRAARGSLHVPQSTISGCLLLITSSIEDELLA